MSLRDEEKISFPEASRITPGHPSINTLHRWRLIGLRDERLETCKIGGKRFTSAAALQRFFDATDPDSQQDHAPRVMAKQRQAAIEAAEQSLVAAGV